MSPPPIKNPGRYRKASTQKNQFTSCKRKLFTQQNGLKKYDFRQKEVSSKTITLMLFFTSHFLLQKIKKILTLKLFFSTLYTSYLTETSWINIPSQTTMHAANKERLFKLKIKQKDLMFLKQRVSIFY